MVFRAVGTICQKNLLWAGQSTGWRSATIKDRPFKWFKTGPEIIRRTKMLCVGFPPALVNLEDLVSCRGIVVKHEAVGY